MTPTWVVRTLTTTFSSTSRTSSPARPSLISQRMLVLSVVSVPLANVQSARFHLSLRPPSKLIPFSREKTSLPLSPVLVSKRSTLRCSSRPSNLLRRSLRTLRLPLRRYKILLFSICLFELTIVFIHRLMTSFSSVVQLVSPRSSPSSLITSRVGL